VKGFIYALRDPRDGLIRYVGQSKNPRNRITQLISSGRYGATTAAENWAALLDDEGLRPELVILHEVSEYPSDALELSEIRRLASVYPLLNRAGLTHKWVTHRGPARRPNRHHPHSEAFKATLNSTREGRRAAAKAARQAKEASA
jgi:hypothetical protein